MNRTRAMVLCAGFGTRMQDLVKDRPKPLLEIDGKPLLERTIEHLVSQGISEIAINVHYKAQMILDYFGDGSRWGASIAYAHESAPSGTAGGVKKMAGFLSGASEFLVLYGDILTNQDFRALVKAHRRNKAAATIILHERTESNSIVKFDENWRIVEFLERPPQSAFAHLKGDRFWVNSGLYCFSSEILQDIPAETFCDFPKDIFPRLVDQGKLYGFPLSGYRCAIDSPARYEQAIEAVRAGRLSAGATVTPSL